MGTVVSGDDGTAGSALSGVTVRAVQSGQAAVTDASGNFTVMGVPGGSQSFQFSRGDIDAKGNIAVVGGATVAVDVRISKRTTVVITPRGNPNAPAQTETMTPTVTGTPPTNTPTSTAATATPTPTGAVVTTTATPCSNSSVEIEGIVTANGGGTLTIFQQGKGTFVVTVPPSAVIRHGQTPISLGDILVGWRVHVKGTSDCSGNITASEVIVQNENNGVTNTPAAATNTPTITPTKTSTPTVTNTSAVTNTVTPTGTFSSPTATPTSTPTIVIPTVGAPR